MKRSTYAKLFILILVCITAFTSCGKRIPSPEDIRAASYRQAEGFMRMNLERGDPISKQWASSWGNALSEMQKSQVRPTPILSEFRIRKNPNNGYILKKIHVIWIDSDDQVAGVYLQVGDKRYDGNDVLDTRSLKAFAKEIIKADPFFICEEGFDIRDPAMKDFQPMLLPKEVIERLMAGDCTDIRVGLILKNGKHTADIPVFCRPDNIDKY